MFDRYDTTTVTNIRSGPDGTQVLVICAVAAAGVIGLGMALAAIAAMIWAVVSAALGLGTIAGAVLIHRDRQKTLQAREYRIVELAARHAPGVPADAAYPAQVIDAAPVRALPPGQVVVNGRPRDESANAARRR